jgi:hypothetical protein
MLHRQRARGKTFKYIVVGIILDVYITLLCIIRVYTMVLGARAEAEAEAGAYRAALHIFKIFGVEHTHQARFQRLLSINQSIQHDGAIDGLELAMDRTDGRTHGSS